ncbi:hypothetical protein VCHA42O253_20272 [Vibrio chagasii]|nr:hypothetical protein VCHA42O253_20272 [Vibrio chagasii]
MSQYRIKTLFPDVLTRSFANFDSEMRLLRPTEATSTTHLYANEFLLLSREVSNHVLPMWI